MITRKRQRKVAITVVIDMGMSMMLGLFPIQSAFAAAVNPVMGTELAVNPGLEEVSGTLPAKTSILG